MISLYLNVEIGSVDNMDEESSNGVFYKISISGSKTYRETKQIVHLKIDFL